jgi:hypothetical protein
MSQTHTIGTHATTVAKYKDGFDVTYWSTCVVSYRKQDDKETIKLRHNGYQTATTKLRMNQTANQYNLPYQVYQEKFQWYLSVNKTAFEFDDDMDIVIKDHSITVNGVAV